MVQSTLIRERQDERRYPCRGSQGAWPTKSRPEYASAAATSNEASETQPALQLLTTLMDWAFVHKVWDKWASTCIGSSGQPLKAALLINHDPTAPSRLLSTIAEQEGINANPIELSQFVNFIKRNELQSESFFIGLNQYVVTSIHENWFSARCMNTSKPAGEGAVVMHTAAFLLVALYDGSIGSASCAMVVVDQFAWQLGRKNL